MTNKPSDSARAQVRALLEQNAPAIMANLIPLIHRTVEDLKVSGVDCAAVAEAVFTVGLGHKAAEIGPAAMSVYLRDVADRFEHIAMSPQPRKN